MNERSVREKTNDIISLSENIFKIKLPNMVVTFNLVGGSVGQAYRTNGIYGIRFNKYMLHNGSLEFMLSDTVPHEVSHIICFANPSMGSGHNSGWAGVCLAIGGTAEPRHTEAYVYARGKTYEYITCKGRSVRVTQRVHNDVQSGQAYSYNLGLGTIHSASSFKIICNGKTSANKAKVAPLPLARSATKASVCRDLMLAGFNAGIPYDQIIDDIVLATGHTKSLARQYFKGNYKSVGMPIPAHYKISC